MDNSKGQLTKEQLSELEAGPKTKGQRILERIACILPLICMGIAILEYTILPDIKKNNKPMVYVGVIGFFAVIYIVWAAGSFVKKERYKKVCYKAPFYSVLLLALTLYDYLTLKSGTLPLPYFPWVNQILTAIIDDYEYLFECTLSTVRLLMIGYCTGVVTGLVTGIACGYSRKVNYWISPIMKFLGPIPTTTWIPIVMVLVDSLFKGSIFIIALGVWYSVALATITGISNVDKSYFEAANTLGSREYQLVFRVAIPAAVPSMFQGMIQGMSIACTALMVAEMMGTESGLGWYITWQKSWAQFAKMYAAIVLICIIFTLVTFVLQKLRRICTRWQEGVVR